MGNYELQITHYQLRIDYTLSIKSTAFTLEETSAWGGFFCIYLTKMMEMWYNRIGEGMAMKKSFDELTIADDYMFCTVMQDEELCKELLSMILKNKVGKIVRLFKQKSIENQIASKGVRLDIMIEDDTGKLYDIEMPFSDRHPCLSENSEFCDYAKHRFCWNHRHPWRFLN